MESDTEYPWEADGHSTSHFTDGETWTQREWVTSWGGAGSSCVKEWGKRRERKSSETQSYLAGWEKGNCWNVAILLQFFSSRQVEKFYIYHPSHPLYAQITEPTCSKNLKGMLESIHPNLVIILMEELRLRGWVTLPSCIIYRTPPGLGPRISTAQCFYTPPNVSAL